MGLSETSTSYNKIPQNRFFLKADTSAGVGVGAYYDTNYTANGGKSVVNSWMKKKEIGQLYMNWVMDINRTTVMVIINHQCIQAKYPTTC